jgi:O-antigen/teichoic acid export membrane protein
MLQTSTGPRARHWSNVVLIFTGLLLAGFAIWAAPLFGEPATVDPVTTWTVYGGAAALSLGALFVAQRRGGQTLSRLLVAAGCLVLVIGLFMFREAGWRVWLTIIVPAIALLLTIPFLGRMPRAAEEPRI